MKKSIFFMLTGTLAFLMGSCGFLPFFQNSDSQEQQNKTAQNVSDPASQAQGNKSDSKASELATTPEAQSFDTPLTPAQPRVPAVANLLPSSNADQRVKAVKQGRADPFALIPVKPGEAVVSINFDEQNSPITNSRSRIPAVPPPPQGNRIASQSNSIPFRGSNRIASQNNGTASRGSGIPTRSNTIPLQRNIVPTRTSSSTPKINNPSRTTTPKQSPTAVAATPSTPINSSSTISGLPPAPSVSLGSGSERFIPQLPAIPKPQLAQAVEVTGVLEVQGVPHAIIKAPNEKFSRHVKAGQYISNGQILIKRIEMNGAPEPIVVFEQLGMEVSKGVGDLEGI